MKVRAGEPLAVADASVPMRLLDASARAALDVAVGGPRPDVLAAMAQSGQWAPADLDPLVASGVVVVGPDLSLAFASAEARARILDRAAPESVREAHRRAAQAGQDLGLPVRQVIDHLVASTYLADESVAGRLAAAATRAEEEDDLSAASDAWQAAARLSTDHERRVERALRALRLVITNGLDYSGVEGLLDLLAGEQLSNECACWVEWVKALQRSDLDPGAAVTAQWSTIRRAREAAPATLRALLWDAAMNAWTLGDAEGGLRAAQEYAAAQTAVGVDESGIEPPWTGTALLSAGLFEVGRVAEAEAHRRTAVEAARDVDPSTVPFDRLLSIVFLDDLLLDLGPQAAERIQVGLQRATPGTAAYACLLGIQAWRARARGDLDAADRLLAAGRPLAASTGATGAQRGMAALGIELAAIRGNAAVLQAEAPRLRAHLLGKGDRRRAATVDRALGLSALADGRLDEAAVFLAAAADVGFLGRRLRDGVLPARIDLVETLVRVGDIRAAFVRAEALTPLLTAMDDPLATALSLRADALVSSGPDAVDRYHEALDAHAQACDPFEQSRTLLLLGEAERRGRRRTEARRHLVAAVSGFSDLGAGVWRERARGELRACGGTTVVGSAVPRGSEGAHPSTSASLTAQEWAVARQAASGLSTREVADVLVLSPRTVEFHLGNVYRKLGIRGRAALAGRLGDLEDRSGGSTSA